MLYEAVRDNLATLLAEANEVGPRPAPVCGAGLRQSLTKRLYAVNAKTDPLANVCRAIGEGFRTLAPDPF